MAVKTTPHTAAAAPVTSGQSAARGAGASAAMAQIEEIINRAIG